MLYIDDEGWVMEVTMTTGVIWDDGVEARFDAYVGELASRLCHADRVGPFTDYCIGLLLPGERKSVEPMAARLAPEKVGAKHQSLLGFIGESGWSDDAVLSGIRDYTLQKIEMSQPITAWIVDDTSHLKKGIHSVGVGRQYCGRIGKVDNCQVAVTLSVANEQASLPVMYRLFLQEDWCKDRERCRKAKVPDGVRYQTKVEISLEQMMDALSQNIRPGVVLADAGYGYDSKFREGVSALTLMYCVGIHSDAMVWPSGCLPLPPRPWLGRGRPPSRPQRDDDHQPISAKDFAKTLPASAWHTITWREGSNTALSSRFAAVRVRSGHGDDDSLIEKRPEEWLLIEWPETEEDPIKFWMSTLPSNTTIEQLVCWAKMRWRIERDYEELKSEIGLSHFEGRGWRGFHHHATLCIAAYAFLVAERAAIPPSGPATTTFRQKSALPNSVKPCGATNPTRTARSGFHRFPQAPACHRSDPTLATVSLLPSTQPQAQPNFASTRLVTQ